MKMTVHNKFEAMALVKEFNENGRCFEFDDGIKFYSHAGEYIGSVTLSGDCLVW